MKPLASSQSRLIVGISGAWELFTVFGSCSSAQCRRRDASCDVKTAEITFAYETALKIADVRALAHTHHRIDDMAASISSGSYRTAGMIVAPCSMRSMSEIATGVTTTLLTRAADVTLKERRRLVLMVRETPLHTGHLRTMTALSQMGAIIAPPVPAFYAKPDTLEDMVDQPSAVRSTCSISMSASSIAGVNSRNYEAARQGRKTSPDRIGNLGCKTSNGARDGGYPDHCDQGRQ